MISRLRVQGASCGLAETLRLDALSLRFHLGTSLADLRVPVHVEPALEELFSAAAKDLFYLLCLRHRAALKDHEYDQLLLLNGFDPKAARPVAFTPPASVSRDGVRRAFLEAPELHPALDSGLFASWIASGRPGRALVGALNVLLRRASEEGGASDLKEPTPYLVLLALRSLAESSLATLHRLPVGQPASRAFQGAVAAGLLVALRLAIRETGTALGPGGTLAEAAVLPLPWLGGLRSLPGSGVACYGVAFLEPVLRAAHLGRKLLDGGSCDSVVREVELDLVSSRDGLRKAGRAVGCASVRRDLLQLLRLGEQGRSPALSLEGITHLHLFQIPGVLERVLTTPERRKELQARAKGAAKAATNEAARTLLEGVGRAAKEWSDDDSGCHLGSSEVVERFSRAVTALACDTALDRALDQAETALAHRSGAESEDGIAVEHERGKLYLLGADGATILKSRSRAPQMGHLFCDMKDFTKRTAFLKEAVVADFLSREFYGPILTAAASYQHGASHLADKGGIYLNNLLGDAVSFSGDIVSLIELTKDIRAALHSYGARLATEGSTEVVARATAAIEARYGEERAELLAAIRSAQKAQARGTLDPISGEEPTHRLRILRAEEQQLEDRRESELSRTSGEQLEAGIFISHGAAPEVATFEDAVFGAIKVSIAEKINESARGTARNGGVRARIDSMLLQLSAERGRTDLICPLTVAVAQPLAMPVSPGAERLLRRFLADGDHASAETVLAESVRDFLQRLASQEEQLDRGDIYNGGAAISEEALIAYVEARGSDLLFLRREIVVAELHPALGEKFVFPMQSLKLVFAVSPSSQSLQELFVYVGSALFRGFERTSGLGIYEIIPAQSELFQLMASHHVASILAEHERLGGEELGDSISGLWARVKA